MGFFFHQENMDYSRPEGEVEHDNLGSRGLAHGSS